MQGMTDNEIIACVISRFREQYPNQNIECVKTIYGDIIRINGEDKFNLTGYNLLYNLYRLTKCLEGELI